MKIHVGVADDDRSSLKSLCILINTFNCFNVTIDGVTGEDIVHELSAMEDPSGISLIEVNMTGENGNQPTRKLLPGFPSVKIAQHAMNDDAGKISNGFDGNRFFNLTKGLPLAGRETAMLEIDQACPGQEENRFDHRQSGKEKKARNRFSEREITFLGLACSDLTYKQIADQMHLSSRTIDGYREAMFEKLNVQSRTGMALEALRKNLVIL